MTLVFTVLALAAPAPHDVCHTNACHDRVQAKVREATDYRLRHACNHRIVSCIDRAAFLHHVSAGWMRSIAWCESRMNPWVTNSSGHMGLYQYDRGTWAAGPYARRGSPFSAKWASLQTAWYLRNGQSSRWVCA